MKFTTQFLLMLLSLFISTNIYSKEAIKTCDELLSDNQYEEALKTKKGEFKSTFCHGQVNLRLKNFDEAIKNFKLADPVHNSDLFLLAEKEIKRIENENEDISRFKPLVKLYDRADIINDIA